MSDEVFAFAAESDPQGSENGNGWKILSVEDDATYQASLLHNLRGITVDDSPVNVLTASSAAMAANVLSEHPDIALVLVDVVMEEDDAGLTLVRSIRDVLGNSAMRVILLTGQPGMAPRKDVMEQYDIDEYWNKSDLTREKLHSVVRSNLRTWQHMDNLNHARKGLQVIIDASRNLYSKQDLVGFAEAVLSSIGKVIDAEGGGIVCSSSSFGADQFEVIAGSGRFSQLNGKTLTPDLLAKYHATLQQAKNSKEHQFEAEYTVLYFETAHIDGYQYLVVVDGQVKPSEHQIYMLQVFSENIRTGFANVALINRVSMVAYFDEYLGVFNRNGLLREIGSMSLPERQHSVLMLVSIRRYPDMMIAFGESYCRNLLMRFTEDLNDVIPDYTCFAVVSSGVFGIVLDKTLVPEPGVMEMAAERTLSIADIEHHLLLSFCRADLSMMAELPAQEILQLAEASLVYANEKNISYTEYKDDYRIQIRDRTLLLQKVQQALLNHSLTIMLQPKVDMLTNEVVGFESLVRIFDENGVMIPPLDFIPLAEASGLITLIDQQVLGMSLEAIQALDSHGYALPVSFNASAKDLFNRHYSKAIFSVVASKLVAPELLDIEITESEMIADFEKFDVLLKQFIALGMGVSIDDFGTGYSSLSRITNLSATTLKIDKSFVQVLGESESALHVVQMICRIGERFGYKIVAEGVETEQQRDILLKAGCRVAQGYLYARPMPLEQVMEWLRKQHETAE